MYGIYRRVPKDIKYSESIIPIESQSSLNLIHLMINFLSKRVKTRDGDTKHESTLERYIKIATNLQLTNNLTTSNKFWKWQ